MDIHSYVFYTRLNEIWTAHVLYDRVQCFILFLELCTYPAYIPSQTIYMCIRVKYYV